MLVTEALEDRRLLTELMVTSLADAGPGTLREAIAVANAAAGPDTIEFDASLHGGVIRLSTGELEVTETLTIDGPGAELLTISGEESSRILHASSMSGDLDLTIQKITLADGRTNGVRQPGGAVWLESSGFVSGALTVHRATIRKNVTEGRLSAGGALAALDVNISESLVTGNATYGDSSSGGAIYGAYTEINKSVISGNATHGDFASGGAAAASFLRISQSTLSRNSTDGIFSYGGSATAMSIAYLYESTIRDNRTHGERSPGGGIDAYFVYAFESTIASNTTQGEGSDGGGMRVYHGGIYSSTISGNSTYGAMSRSGGISNYELLTARHTTVTGNKTFGGGSGGGGITTWGLTGSEILIADNEVDLALATAPDLQVFFFDAEYSLIGDNTGNGLAEAPIGTPDANGNLIGAPSGQGVIDPRLGPLQFNGGPTETHAPLAGSPARDAGDPTAQAGIGGTPLFDQRGTPFSRVVGGRVDIGAIESPVDGDFNNNAVYDCLDIDALVVQIAAGGNDPDFDMTGDGLVDLKDRNAWLAEAGTVNLGPGRTYLLGDANLDGFVDAQDFIVWNRNKFSPLPVVFGWCEGNFNADGVVDGKDFLIWNDNKFQSSDAAVGMPAATAYLRKVDNTGHAEVNDGDLVRTTNSAVRLPSWNTKRVDSRRAIHQILIRSSFGLNSLSSGLTLNAL